MMGTRRFLCAATIALLFIGSFETSAESAQGAQEPPANSVVIYYFHGDFRCVNCRKIEQYTKEAVEKYFKDELNSGKIIFQVINVDTKDNEHFVNDYRLYTKSVVLSLVKDGKEVKSSNLAKIWEFLRDRDAFHQYIKSEIEKYLREL